MILKNENIPVFFSNSVVKHADIAFGFRRSNFDSILY
jgi:hypothetical protein